MNTKNKVVAQARAAGRANLNEAEGKALLADFGIPTPKSEVVETPEAGAKAAATMAAPFVVKVVSSEILHKSDAGGVALHVPDASAVERTIEEMAQKPVIAAANVDGWLVEEMAPKGREAVIGGFRDPQFGPMLMVGLGGVFVEVLKDVSFRLCPIDRSMAQDMLSELKGYALLQGARGEAGVDTEALIDAMMALGGADGLLLRYAQEIAEVDINPVIVSENGAVAVDAAFVLAPTSETSTPVAQTPEKLSASQMFKPLFEPQTIAVLGASTRDVTIANTFIRRLKDFGYQGEIYPIHPKADEIEGLKAYSSLSKTPREIDYAYIAIGAERIAEALEQGAGRVRVAQVISSGFGEVEEGHELQADLVQRARAAGIRVLGPNCLGTYSPRGGLTFPVGAPKDTGKIGIISQSGGLSTDIIKRGQWRGLRFSGLVTIGNSADVKPHELVDYYFSDPQTRAVGLYIEDIRDGRAFVDVLRNHPTPKPVVVLKGGRTADGRLAAASHTGALAGDDKAWDILGAQFALAMNTTVDEFIDTLLALQHFDLRPQKPTREVTLFGNGGGSSVLGADIFSHYGLKVAPFEGKAREALDAMGLPPGTSVINPIDTPVRTLQEQDGWIAGEILDYVFEHARPDAIAMHLNLAAFVGRGTVDPIGNLFEVVRQTLEKWPDVAHFALAMRTDGSPELDQTRRDYRARARDLGFPIYDEIPAMARALAHVGHLERMLAVR